MKSELGLVSNEMLFVFGFWYSDFGFSANFASKSSIATLIKYWGNVCSFPHT